MRLVAGLFRSVSQRISPRESNLDEISLSLTGRSTLRTSIRTLGPCEEEARTVSSCSKTEEQEAAQSSKLETLSALLRVNRYRSLERLAAEITPSFMRLNFPPSHSFWALFFVYLISTYRDPRASILLVTSTHLRR